MKTEEQKKKSCAETIMGLIMGGTTMIGLGVGFFLLEISSLAFVGSLMTGIGLGLLIAPIAVRRTMEKELMQSK